MTRNEMLRFISENNELASLINQCEAKNFTRVKDVILREYIDKWLSVQPQQIVQMPKEPANNEGTVTDVFETAALKFLVALEQAGVLDSLLAKIK